jgi:hypothetical protein
MKKPIYRTVVKIVILSDEPYDLGNSLSDIDYDINDGDCSGKVTYEYGNKILLGKNAIKEIQLQGSYPEFFGIDEKGNELYDAD